MSDLVSRINVLFAPLVHAQQPQPPSSATMPPVAAEPPAGPLNNRVQRRRDLKSALYFAVSAAVLCGPTATRAYSDAPVRAFSGAPAYGRPGLPRRRHEWIERSVRYYSGVMKTPGSGAAATAQPRRKTQTDSSNAGAAEPSDETFLYLATEHYYARSLVKRGKMELAEKIYRRIIAELEAERAADESCHHAKLAVSALLLALHMQRTGNIKATRAVFLDFFRRVSAVDDESSSPEEERRCSCSAKVLQAYALFEMKNGHSNKSLEIIRRAVRMDEGLRPVLGWKQFRDAAAGREFVPKVRCRKLEKWEVGQEARC